MKKRGWIPLFMACALLVAPVAQGINIGDTAPPLTYHTWVKNQPTQFMDGSHVTVIELWATWCGPCYSVVPVLTQLQAQYRDFVHIVGASREGPNLVVPYVEAQGDRMNYSVCSNGEAIWWNYNDGFYSHAVIVDQTMHVVWQGSAFDLADPLAAAVNGGVFIENNPVGGVWAVGQDHTLSVSLAQVAPVNYAWTRNGQPVGGNSPTLSLADLSFADQGDYVCTVTRADNPDMSVQSAMASVRVMPAGDLPVASPWAVAALTAILLAGGMRSLKRKSSGIE